MTVTMIISVTKYNSYYRLVTTSYNIEKNIEDTGIK